MTVEHCAQAVLLLFEVAITVKPVELVKLVKRVALVMKLVTRAKSVQEASITRPRAPPRACIAVLTRLEPT